MGKRNINLFILFLIIATIFLILKFTLSTLGTVKALCWNEPDPNKNYCEYNFSILGSLGNWMNQLYINKDFGFYLFYVINWIYILVTFCMLVMVCILLKISLSNFYRGKTTYEIHLQNKSRVDSILRRELEHNFSD